MRVNPMPNNLETHLSSSGKFLEVKFDDINDSIHTVTRVLNTSEHVNPEGIFCHRLKEIKKSYGSDKPLMPLVLSKSFKINSYRLEENHSNGSVTFNPPTGSHARIVEVNLPPNQSFNFRPFTYFGGQNGLRMDYGCIIDQRIYHQAVSKGRKPQENLEKGIILGSEIGYREEQSISTTQSPQSKGERLKSSMTGAIKGIGSKAGTAKREVMTTSRRVVSSTPFLGSQIGKILGFNIDQYFSELRSNFKGTISGIPPIFLRVKRKDSIDQAIERKIFLLSKTDFEWKEVKEGMIVNPAKIVAFPQTVTLQLGELNSSTGVYNLHAFGTGKILMSPDDYWNIYSGVDSFFDLIKFFAGVKTISW